MYTFRQHAVPMIRKMWIPGFTTIKHYQRGKIVWNIRLNCFDRLNNASIHFVKQHFPAHIYEEQSRKMERPKHTLFRSTLINSEYFLPRTKRNNCHLPQNLIFLLALTRKLSQWFMRISIAHSFHLHFFPVLSLFVRCVFLLRKCVSQWFL